MKKILVIQTAFIGDVILATSILEKLHVNGYEHIDFLLRKGNESIFDGHPFVNHVFIWNKKEKKYKNLIGIIKEVRNQKYDYVINLQRFFTTGLITVLSKGKKTFGFQKNPLSFFFTKRYPHFISAIKNTHEIERNNILIHDIISNENICLPKLYPSEAKLIEYSKLSPYVTISPCSVWYTKQFPFEKWIRVIEALSPTLGIYLLGGKSDYDFCFEIQSAFKSRQIEIMAGKLSFLESAALIKCAKMNFVNDSAPMHMASATNASVTVIFCSTVPAFGFGPLSTHSKIAQISFPLSCRPCGLHGYKKCPKDHFKCSDIAINQIVDPELQNE